MFGEKYDFMVGSASYIKKPLDEVWKIIETSNKSLDSVLALEKSLSARFPEDRKFTMVQKGKKLDKGYSDEYVAEYNKLLNGMVERRMRAAVHEVGSFWYTAWVNAGQPSLDLLQGAEPVDTLKQGDIRE